MIKLLIQVFLLFLFSPAFAGEPIPNEDNHLANITTNNVPSTLDIQLPQQAPVKDTPIQIGINLRIIKIFDVDPVAETYRVDAYIDYSWLDIRNDRLIPDGRNSITLEDLQVDDFDNAIWNPAFEIINNIDTKEISNKRLVVSRGGKITYNERFKATLSSDMNFHLFPFDSHKLTINIEAFSHDTKTLNFSENPQVYPKTNKEWNLNSWRPKSRTCRLSANDYSYLSDSTGEDSFHRFSFVLEVERKPGYFIWQILLPLFIIMISAWSAFHVRDFSTQIGLISTLMLTVYAFNFFISGSIPQLSYNTFLEMIIITSFLNIFLQLATILIIHNKNIELTTLQTHLLTVGFFVIFIACCAISWQLSNGALTSESSNGHINRAHNVIESDC